MKMDFTIEVGGRTMTFETGRLAKQAGGSVAVNYGGSMVLVAATASDEEKPFGYLPLMVEYREKAFAAGNIPGGFFKREGRPSEKEVLTARLIDRPVRPLFEDFIRYDLQIIANVFSADKVNDTDIMALNGASLALLMFPIPWKGPIGGVRVGMINGEYVINPLIPDLENSKLDIIVAGTENAVTMVEGWAKELSEDEMLQAIEFASVEIKKICEAQLDFVAKMNITKRELSPPEMDNSFVEVIEGAISIPLVAILDIDDKNERNDARQALLDGLIEKYAPEDDPDADSKQKDIKNIYFDMEKKLVRKQTLVERRRNDGRAFDEIRPISIEVSLLERTHGSALFTRGQTQALVTTTLGTVSDQQRIDDLLGDRFKSFMLHYNFPPFSVGEVRPMRGTSRREIGHGVLAEKAISPVLPGEDEFPYTIRIVSDILESNGSSSMASVCGASLALMDAGVPISKAVAGVAMGMMSDAESGDYAILTDIQGMEDHYGDMDYKVAGTSDGITSFQMDLKMTGISIELMREAMEQARRARVFILGTMDSIISTHRSELSPYAPRLITFYIPIEKIGAVIGPGGKNIRRIISDTGVEIDIEDDGRVTIASTDGAAATAAREEIEQYTAEAEVGKVYNGKVVRIMNFGAFVEIIPGIDGMVHISDLEWHRVGKVEDVLNVGDEVQVKVMEIDGQGRVNLSRKELIPRPEGVGRDDDKKRGDRGGRDRRGDKKRRR